jgi:hypothetical protein
MEFSWMREDDSFVEKSFTGIETSPKLIVPDAIGRAIRLLL